MTDVDHPFSVDSPQNSPYEICGGDALRRIIDKHPPSIPFSNLLLDAGIRPEDSRMSTPLYGAGFFIDGDWFNQVYLPRMNLKRRGNVLSMLHRDKKLCEMLHLTTRIISYYDYDGCVFVCLCCNIGRFKREPWFSRRDEVLDAVCKTMQLTEAETAKAKGAFQWHMIEPLCYARIPKEFIVGV